MNDGETELPSDEDILKNIKEFVREVDINTMGQKSFVKLLAKRMNVRKLSKKKAFIIESLTEILNSENSDDDADTDDDNNDENLDNSEEQTEASDESDHNETKDAKPKKNNPFNTPKELSKPLADFLGKGTHLSRPQVVKCMWEYIREHDLQNPENKQEILLDSSMQQVFGVEKFSMFRMATYISAHIFPFKPVTFDDDKKGTKKRKKKEISKKVRKKRKVPTKRKFATYQLSEPLSELTGLKVLTRQKVVKKIIEYIREHDLQDPDDRRKIRCDHLLKRIMGKQATVTFFSMQKYITPHLLEKVGIDDGEDEDDVDEEE